MRRLGIRFVPFVVESGSSWSFTSEMNRAGFPLGLGWSLSARTSGVTVAVKSKVSRSLEAGNVERHVPMFGSIPAEDDKSRSASSKTTTLTLRNPRTVSSPEVSI